MLPCVLLIDDDPLLRDTLPLVLQADGYAACVLRLAQATLPAIQACGPQVILLDYGYPQQQTSQALLTALRTDSALAALPIILLTTQPDLLTPHAAWLTAQQIPIVRKPYVFAGVLDHLQRLLRP